MEEIINKLIDIDNMSKEVIDKIEKKSLNIDELIENEIDKKKSKIDATINMKLKLKKDGLDNNFKEFKSNLDIETNKNIEKIIHEYQNIKQDRVDKIVNNIINN